MSDQNKKLESDITDRLAIILDYSFHGRVKFNEKDLQHFAESEIKHADRNSLEDKIKFSPESSVEFYISDVLNFLEKTEEKLESLCFWYFCNWKNGVSDNFLKG